MNKLIIGLSALVLTACGSDAARTVTVADYCTVKQASTFKAVITCPDGSTVDLDVQTGVVSPSPAPKPSPTATPRPTATPAPTATPVPSPTPRRVR